MKKRKRSAFELLWISGIPWYLVAVFVGIKIAEALAEQRGEVFIVQSFEDLKNILLFALVFWLYVVVMNTFWTNSDKKIGPFTWLEKYDHEPPSVTSRKRKAQYPDPGQEYLSDKPDGLVLGRYGNRFVRVPLRKGNILNAIIMGAPGCGKSVLLLTMLIYQLNHKPTQKERDAGWEPMTFFTLDIKPELCRKSTKIKGNRRVHMMNPVDRSSYGWDPYYNLKSDTSDDDVMSELDTICRALIDAGKGGEKNEFFYESARSIAKAILFYTYKQGRSFIQGLNFLTDGDLAEVVAGTLKKVEGRMEYKQVWRLLKPYEGKTGEAFEGIELAFRQSLPIFSNQSVQFFLDGNRKKASPLDLEEKISVFFSIPETKIDEYKPLLRLVTMQVIQHCSGRPESSHMLTLIIDEAARLGSINWMSFLATSRSRQIATILAFQSLNQMETVWSKEEAKSLIELCRVISVLSCTDPDTAKMFSEWAGEYKEERKSVNKGGKNEGSYSSSFDDKKILQPSDIMNLQDLNEAILFLKGQYCRCDVSKAQYFNIKELNDISQECLAYNQESEVNGNGGNQEHADRDGGSGAGVNGKVGAGVPDLSDSGSAGSDEN